MSFFRLAWRNANGNRFRTYTVFISAAWIAGFAVAATIIIGGAQRSLTLALERLGADIVVVSSGSEQMMENAFLMGVPVQMWMPRTIVDEIATVPGVDVVSPQFFLSTLRGANCCSVPEMFLIAYEPETDFTLKPWLEGHHGEGLALGEAIGGAFVYVPVDPGFILVYGYELDLMGTLEPTGTGLDQSMFFTFETAADIARLSTIQAEQELEIPADSVSAAMVKVEKGQDIARVAEQIELALPGVTAVTSSNLFHSQRVQILGLLQSVVALLSIAWLFAVAMIGLTFSVVVNERRQEIGVLRALGLRRRFVLESLLAEGLIFALLGGTAGIAYFLALVYLYHDLISRTLGLPFLIPQAGSLFLLSGGALLLALASVTAGALLPTVRITRMEPALAMRK